MEPTDLPLRPREPSKNLSDALQRLGIRVENYPAPPSAAVWLAGVLAERLNTVAPPPFRLQADGAWLSYYNGAQYDGSTDLAGLLAQYFSGTFDWIHRPKAAPLFDGGPGEQDGSLPIVRVVGFCRNVLSSLQDRVAEETRDPWPRLPSGQMALPGARAEAGRVYLWYGPDDESDTDAVLLLAPIELIDTMRP